MFNLNIPPTSLLGVDSGGLCSTPKTPEIVNSLIAMTNPLDNYTFTPNNNNNNNCNNNNNNNNNCENSNSNNQNGGILILHQQKQNFKNNNINNNSANQQLVSQDSSHSSCSGSPLDSPCGTNTTPSVQQTRSQLIKAGLKLSIQSKRKMSSGDSSSGNEQSSSRKYARKSIGDSSITNDGDSSDEEDDSYADIKPSQLGLTPEDEDRRRRRRERNKIAATKCRMKKRERTINLVSESETLETQNVDLKTQVKSLEIERRKLFEMLQNHACVHPGGYQPPTKLLQSPAYKYLKNLGLGNGSGGGDDGDDEDDDDIICNEQQHNQQQQQQQQPRTVIPPVATIKYSRNNGLRQLHQQQQQQHQQQQQQHNLQDILPNGYCKPSPTTHELGYLSSPTQDLTTCHLQQALNNINNHIQQQQQLHQQQQHHQQHQQQQQQQQIHSPILKTDYIPNCENSNGGTTVDSTTVDFVMKSELAETQSPYTTAKSAERFLCETNFDSFDIKNNSNSFNNHNNNNNNNNINNNNNCTSHLNNNNNTNSIDFHSQLAISCQSYDHILIKNDFLTHDSELLAQLAADGTESEFTDLDTGVSAYVHMTNGGCLA